MTERDDLRDRVDAVRELHSRTYEWPVPFSDKIAHCCVACEQIAPCPTIRLLDEPWHTESICATDMGSSCLNELCTHRICTICHKKWPCEMSRK